MATSSTAVPHGGAGRSSRKGPLRRLWGRLRHQSAAPPDLPAERAAPGRAKTAGTAATASGPEILWPAERFDITDALWGDGFLNPGGESYALDLVRLLGLDETSSLLNLGAGLGGPARAWVEGFGVWVDAFEQDPELAAKGMDLSTRRGMSRKAPVAHYDPDTAEFRKGRYHAVVGLEALFTVTDKERLFHALEAALRLDGHLLFTDLVLADARPPDEALRAWFQTEPVRPHLWTARQVYAKLAELKFDVRVAEDVTADYRARVLGGWANLVAGLGRDMLTPAFGAALVGECEFWLRRVAALDAGGLRVYRYHAQRTP